MTRQHLFLFIGGPWDGRIVPVAREAGMPVPQIMVRVPSEPTAYRYESAPPLSTAAECPPVVYERGEIAHPAGPDEQTRTFVYRTADITDDQAVAAFRRVAS